MFVGILIGMFLWQFIVFVVAIVTNENESAIIYTGEGIFTFIGLIYRAVCLMRFKRKYNCYAFYGRRGWIGNYYMTPKLAENFRTTDKSGDTYTIKLIRQGKDFKSYPYEHEIISDIYKGCSGMSPDFLKFFLK